MKKVIIAEKPSLAKSVKEALETVGEKFSRADGFYESQNYIVTSAFGHLFELYDVNDYLGVEKKWREVPLPFVPVNGEFKLGLKKDAKTKKTDNGVKKQYLLIKKLIERNDVNGVIHCGDADREGEIIVRIILENIGNTKPVERLFITNTTKDAIVKGVGDMKPDNIAFYDNWANEGMSRMYIDWLYGINLSRYATLKTNTFITIGRVLTVIVNAIYERDMEIKHFKPTVYYQAVSSVEGVDLTVKDKYDENRKSDCENLCDELNRDTLMVTDKKRKTRTVAHPKLFSQTSLQNALGKKFKYSPNETLSIVQKLYEGGYVTYPRTPSEYLTTDEKNTARAVIDKINRKDGNILVFKDEKSIFDDSKVESHSAIIPTGKFPDVEKLQEKERNVYNAIYGRFCAVFCEENCTVEGTELTIESNNANFSIKGTTPLMAGWKVYDMFFNEKEKLLPKLEVGDSVKHLFKCVEKKTTPPKHYTIESLNNFLSFPFKKELQPDTTDEDYANMLNGVEIGTTATRPNIIKGAIDNRYISLKGDTYTITNDGKYYIESIKKLDIDMTKEKSVELNMTIKKVNKRELTIDDAVQIAVKEISDTIEKDVQIEKRLSVDTIMNMVDEKCPECGSPLVNKNGKYGSFLGCSNYPTCKYIKKKEKSPSKKTEEMCPECGKPLVIRKGKFGEFYSCSGYPSCRYTKNKK